MKKIYIINVLMACGLILAVSTMGGEPPPATRPTFEQRWRESIKRLIFVGSRPMTNRAKVLDEDLVAVKAATPESISKPSAITSYYMPEMENGAGMFIFWIEDQPSVREFTVRNPETKESIRVEVTKSGLDEAAKDASSILDYRYFFTLPDGFVKGVTQALEVSAPGQSLPATCYPSIYSESDIRTPATRP